MKLIVGLGNPGKKYELTRHNAGFMAVGFILNDGDGFMEARPSHEFKSEVYTWISPTATSGLKDKEKILFIKPQTYMNDSGRALKLFCNFYKMDFPKDLLIIHDDVDLPFGAIRLANGSSSAGHKGVESIIENLGTQNFARLRVGVETRASRDEMPTDDFVLQNFTTEELKKLQDDILPKVKLEVEKFLKIEN